MRLSSSLMLAALLASGCCKKNSSTSTDVTPTRTATTADTTTAAPTSTAPAKPPPLDDATKKKLTDLFDKNKVGIAKCDPQKNDLHKSIAAKDFAAVPAKSVAYNGCRRGWVAGLMPQIAKIGSISEDQAVDEMMAWDLARKK